MRQRDCFIVGCGRSGTSLLAGCMSGCGYSFGPKLYPARRANAKGFFESRVINGINERLIQRVVPRRGVLSTRLRRSSVPGAGQRWLARVPLETEIDAGANEARQIMTLVKGQPFCFKDPRFSYTLELWRRHAIGAACICVFRHPLLTAESILRECNEAAYLRGLDLSLTDAMDVWRLMHLHVLRRHAECGDWLFIHFEQLIHGEAFTRIHDMLGVTPDHSFPDRRLSRSASTGPLPDDMGALYRELCDRAGYRDPTDDPTVAACNAAR